MNPQLTFSPELSGAAADRGMFTASAQLAEWRHLADYLIFTVWNPGDQFTADDLIEAIGLPTTEDGTATNNGVGGYLSGLATGGRIRRIGYCNSTRASNHSRVLRLWEVA